MKEGGREKIYKTIRGWISTSVEAVFLCVCVCLHARMDDVASCVWIKRLGKNLLSNRMIKSNIRTFFFSCKQNLSCFNIIFLFVCFNEVDLKK